VDEIMVKNKPQNNIEKDNKKKYEKKYMEKK